MTLRDSKSSKPSRVLFSRKNSVSLRACCERRITFCETPADRQWDIWRSRRENIFLQRVEVCKGDDKAYRTSSSGKPSSSMAFSSFFCLWIKKNQTYNKNNAFKKVHKQIWIRAAEIHQKHCAPSYFTIYERVGETLWSGNTRGGIKWPVRSWKQISCQFMQRREQWVSNLLQEAPNHVTWTRGQL